VPDESEGAAIVIDAIYDPKTAKNLTNKLTAEQRAQLAELIEPVLRNE
jgi:hypothetical protein